MAGTRGISGGDSVGVEPRGVEANDVFVGSNSPGVGRTIGATHVPAVAERPSTAARPHRASQAGSRRGFRDTRTENVRERNAPSAGDHRSGSD